MFYSLLYVYNVNSVFLKVFVTTSFTSIFLFSVNTKNCYYSSYNNNTVKDTDSPRSSLIHHVISA